MTISQTGCSFNAALTGFGTFKGTVSGNNVSYTITLGGTCTGTATGTGSVSGSAMNGTYSGTQSGNSNCCSPMTGSFSVQFAPTPSTSITPGITVTPTPLP
jgi:hypothetical protein